jgi:hypothetical protein
MKNCINQPCACKSASSPKGEGKCKIGTERGPNSIEVGPINSNAIQGNKAKITFDPSLVIREVEFSYRS